MHSLMHTYKHTHKHAHMHRHVHTVAKDIKYGVWSPKTDVYGDIDGGFPLVVFDATMDNTVVLSPMNSFMSANQISFTEDVSGYKVLTFGPISSIDEVREFSGSDNAQDQQGT